MASQSRADLPGELDPSFGVNGNVRLTKAGGIFSNAKQALIDGSGQILLAGTFKTHEAEQYAVVRLTADGDQDSSFGDRGVVVGSFIDKKDARANSVTITQDNKILLSGSSGARQAGSGSALTVFMGGIARFDQAGTLDTSFGSMGHISLSIRHPADQKPVGLKITSDDVSDPIAGVVSSVDKNKILYTWMGPTRSMDSGIYLAYAVLGRLKTDGTSDESFQKEGHVYIRYLTGKSVLITSVKCHIILNGGIIVAGYIVNDDAPVRGYLSRYDLNGKVDTAFGGSAQTDGFVLTPPLGEIRSDGDIAALVQHESTLILVGNASGQGVMAAYTLDGAVDQTFNLGNLLYADLPGSKRTVTWLDAASSDGGILALGYIGVPELGEFVIARYLASGVLDTRFGSGQGWVFSTLGVQLKALVVQRREGGLPNRILVTGVVVKGEYAVVMAFTDVKE